MFQAFLLLGLKLIDYYYENEQSQPLPDAAALAGEASSVGGGSLRREKNLDGAD